MLALLNLQSKFDACFLLQGTVAYVPQQAWVQNTTIKDNILFGSNLDNMKYGEVIEACGLGPVLDKIPGRDTAALIEVKVCMHV